MQTYGGVDCAVNNAGTEATGLIADSTDDLFDQLIAVNLKGLLSCLRHEIAAMRVRGGGSIVNMSSVTSDITAVPANGLYAARKGGVNALTKAAAGEVAKDNISVNSLAFAAIDIPGDMIWRFLESQGITPEQLMSVFPIGRMGRPEELVAAVRYLCSDDARFVTGSMLTLDGRVYRAIAFIATAWPDRPRRDRSGPGRQVFEAPRGGSSGQAAPRRFELPHPSWASVRQPLEPAR